MNCSFCDRSKHDKEINFMLARKDGPGICDLCIKICMDTVFERMRNRVTDWPAPEPSAEPNP